MLLMSRLFFGKIWIGLCHTGTTLAFGISIIPYPQQFQIVLYWPYGIPMLDVKLDKGKKDTTNVGN